MNDNHVVAIIIIIIDVVVVVVINHIKPYSIWMSHGWVLTSIHFFQWKLSENTNTHAQFKAITHSVQCVNHLSSTIFGHTFIFRSLVQTFLCTRATQLTVEWFCYLNSNIENTENSRHQVDIWTLFLRKFIGLKCTFIQIGIGMYRFVKQFVSTYIEHFDWILSAWPMTNVSKLFYVWYDKMILAEKSLTNCVSVT